MEAQKNNNGGSLWNWFDPRNRQPGSWAFILNRITGLGLTLYLFLHLIILGKLAQGPQAYDDFIALAKSPLILVGEFLVIAAGLIHGLNGIRVILTSFGIGNAQQKHLFYGLFAVAIVASALFAVRMFGFGG
jgi:succinate dehydrogenase / fumarate reductase, cytochrome b subunit